jgi:hypothetical protein
MELKYPAGLSSHRVEVIESQMVKVPGKEYPWEVEKLNLGQVYFHLRLPVQRSLAPDRLRPAPESAGTIFAAYAHAQFDSQNGAVENVVDSTVFWFPSFKPTAQIISLILPI